MNELLYSVLNSTGYDIYLLAAPQNKKPPFAVYTPVTQTAEMCAGGLTDFEEINYSLDVYAFDYKECKSIMGELLQAINISNSFKTVIYNLNDGIESDGKTVYSRLDFTLYNK